MREAKADYYEALAGLKNADAAYRQAEARYQDACTALKNAKVAEQELKNAYQELVNAKKEADDEIAIAKAKAELEKTLVYWQTELTKQEQELAQAEYNLEQELRNIAAKSIGLNAQERSVLNEAISGYEQALTDYNATYRELYEATKKLFKAQYDVEAAIASLNEKTEGKVVENTVNWAEDYEDSIAFYALVQAGLEEKLAEYTLTDDPAVWEAELAEIQDSLDYWRYQANIVDADMAKKFANEYFDGVKAWNEAYAAYVEANEPAEPKLIDPDGYLFHDKAGDPADYTKQLPVHTPATDKFVSHFNSYLKEWCDYVRVWHRTFPVEKAYIYTEKKGAEDVFVVEDLRIDNYDLFLNGNPDDKDVLGLNGILETLERDLVLQGDATTVAKLKEEKEAAEKAFNTADSIVRAGLMAYKPFADTLALYKEAVSGMNADAKALYEAQNVLVKEIVDYAQGLGQHNPYYVKDNPVSSNADSVALFNAIKNFAVARAKYFGNGAVLADHWVVTEKVATAWVKYLNTIPYYTYNGSFTAQKDSVNFEDIVFSGFQQAAVLPAYLSPIPTPTSSKDIDGYYWADGMFFNSLYGGDGIIAEPTPVPYYAGHKVNLGNTYWEDTYVYPGTPNTKSSEFWYYAYQVGQKVPAEYSLDDAFIKAIYKITYASVNGDTAKDNIADKSVDFWDSVITWAEAAASAEVEKATRESGIYGCVTAKDANGKYHVYCDNTNKHDVKSQEVIKLEAALEKIICDYIKKYNQYWGEDTDPEHKAAFLRLVKNWKFYDKDGNEITIYSISDVEDVITKIASIKEVDGQVYSYHWSVKTFTEPYNIVNFEKAWSDRVVYVVDSKELEIVFDNLPIEYSVLGNAFLTAIFNGSKDMTLLAKMLYAEDQYAMYANAKDAIEIVKQLKGVDAEVKAAAAEVQKALDADKAATEEYTKKYGEFYTALTGKKPLETVGEMITEVEDVMDDEDFILNHIAGGKWTVGGEMKAMAEKALPTYPADVNATQQLKGHSAEMVELYEGLYNALDKTYLTAVVMKDGALTEGQLVTIPTLCGEWSFVWGVWSFEQAYENVIKNCNDGIALCEAKIAYFERAIALEEAGFAEYEATIMLLEHEVERLTQKLADAQIQLDVAKAKYDAAIAAYAE